MAGCSTLTAKNESLPSAKVLSGKIFHLETKPYTYKGAFHFTSESYATVTLDYCENLSDDARCRVLDKQTIKGFKSFPIDFAVYSKGPEDCNDPGYLCSLSVEVHSRGGPEMGEGDLIIEYATDFQTPLPISGVKLEATGLEKCGEPDAGGFCL